MVSYFSKNIIEVTGPTAVHILSDQQSQTQMDTGRRYTCVR